MLNAFSIVGNGKKSGGGGRSRKRHRDRGSNSRSESRLRSRSRSASRSESRSESRSSEKSRKKHSRYITDDGGDEYHVYMSRIYAIVYVVLIVMTHTSLHAYLLVRSYIYIDIIVISADTIRTRGIKYNTIVVIYISC